jgi:hypothetical protein
VRSVRDAPITTIGFTTATHRRLIAEFEDGHEESFVLKTASPLTDWTAIRTGDTTGREVAMLEEPSLAAVWECVASPYVACAREEGTVALLMRDLSQHLFADVREPLRIDEESALLSALARLHARFWDLRDAPATLTNCNGYIDCLRPLRDESDLFGAMPAPLRQRIADGWKMVARRAPKPVLALLDLPADEVALVYMNGPRTLVHGDAKVANFAFDPGSSTVWAFDWAIAGCAPAGVDLGWYLCLNASRIAESKEAALIRYRDAFDQARGSPLRNSEWMELERSMIVHGAMMGLWSKAFLLESKASNADREWDWWMDRITAVA